MNKLSVLFAVSIHTVVFVIVNTEFATVTDGVGLLSGLTVDGEITQVQTSESCDRECNFRTLCDAMQKCSFLKNSFASGSHTVDPNKLYILANDDSVHVKNSSKPTFLAYRMTSGVGGDVLSFYGGQTYSDPSKILDAHDFSKPVTETYKSPIIENWSAFSIIKVRLEYRKPSGECEYIDFSADNTTNKMNWMNQLRVMSDPWDDFDSTSATVDFGISGDDTAKNRFYIMKNDDDCPTDFGFFKVINPQQAGQCPAFQQLTDNPSIVYSPFANGVKFSDGTFQLASEMAIYVTFDFKDLIPEEEIDTSDEDFVLASDEEYVFNYNTEL